MVFRIKKIAKITVRIQAPISSLCENSQKETSQLWPADIWGRQHKSIRSLILYRAKPITYTDLLTTSSPASNHRNFGLAMSPAPKELSILIVDDEADLLDVMVEFFEESEAFSQVFQAPEGENAIKILQSHPIDILLTDINMPGGMGGFELIRRLEQEPTIKPPTIVIMSGYLENQEQIEKLSLPFCRKPIKEIKAFIQQIANLHSPS